jgi:hypothetical protein
MKYKKGLGSIYVKDFHLNSRLELHLIFFSRQVR